jgi:hypothetical protein
MLFQNKYLPAKRQFIVDLHVPNVIPEFYNIFFIRKGFKQVEGILTIGK